MKFYKSEKYYVDHIYTARRFVKEWPNLNCSALTLQMVQRFLIKRSRVSAFTANKDLGVISGPCLILASAGFGED